MSKRISVVLPIHNEMEYLPFSLNNLIKCPIDELVIILDRCNDDSEKIILKTRFPFDTTIVMITQHEWCFPIAENFNVGFSLCTGDYFFTMAGDFLLDANEFNLKYWRNADVLSFFHWDFSMDKWKIKQQYTNFLMKHFHFKAPRTSGHIAFKREVWEKIGFRDTLIEDKDFLDRAIQFGFKYKFVDGVNNYHLRPNLSREDSLFKGVRYRYYGKNWLKVLFHSFLYLEPHVFAGYKLTKNKTRSMHRMA
jgi:glycosyltransferase involved in cell wall biosynthesis